MTPSPPESSAGRLAYLMGPSGAGKDALMSYARARINPAEVAFVHRYITRAADAGGENHVMLSEAEFAARREAGLFALSWNSHGFWYGIGVEVEEWLARGFVVLVSGSRAVWPQAKARYPGLLGIFIDAPAELRAQRLAARGREAEPAIRARLGRDVSLAPEDGLCRLDNSGALGEAGDKLVELLKAAKTGVDARRSAG